MTVVMKELAKAAAEATIEKLKKDDFREKVVADLRTAWKETILPTMRQRASERRMFYQYIYESDCGMTYEELHAILPEEIAREKPFVWKSSSEKTKYQINFNWEEKTQQLIRDFETEQQKERKRKRKDTASDEDPAPAPAPAPATPKEGDMELDVASRQVRIALDRPDEHGGTGTIGADRIYPKLLSEAASHAPTAVEEAVARSGYRDKHVVITHENGTRYIFRCSDATETRAKLDVHHTDKGSMLCGTLSVPIEAIEGYADLTGHYVQFKRGGKMVAARVKADQGKEQIGVSWFAAGELNNVAEYRMTLDRTRVFICADQQKVRDEQFRLEASLA